MSSQDQIALFSSPGSRRRGVSLIELLVVITIMLIITAAAIPTLAPAMANRRVRETARLTSSFLSGARARAIENGRPVGVQFEPLDGVPGASMLLTYVETPPPYCGETTTSAIQFNSGTPGPPSDPNAGWSLSLYENGTQAPTNPPHPIWGVVKAGDLFRLGYQGHLFRITKSDGVKWWISSETVPDASLNGVLNGYHPAPLSYQIYRQPIRSASAPLQLPESMVVDLGASGVGGTSFGPITGPVVVTFSPSGSVSTVSVAGGAPFRPTSSIFFLVGQRSKLPLLAYTNTTDPADAAKKHNFRDLQNLWVSINPSSGLVTTSPVAAITPVNSGTPQQQFIDDVALSRSLARDAQTLGGN